MFDVRPGFSVNNSPYQSLIHSKHTRNLSLRKSVFRKIDNFLNVGFLKLRQWMFRSKNKCSGVYFVLDIFFLGSLVKMIWVNAFPVIAFVQDIKRFANLTFENFPRSSVCKNNSSYISGFSANSSQVKDPITGWNRCSDPLPASWCFLDFREESFNISNFINHHQTMMTLWGI